MNGRKMRRHRGREGGSTEGGTTTKVAGTAGRFPAELALRGHLVCRLPKQHVTLYSPEHKCSS